MSENEATEVSGETAPSEISMDEEMSAAYDKAQEEPEAVVEETAPEAKEEVSEESKESEETAPEEKEPKEEPVVEETTSEEETKEGEEVKPPAGWDPETKEIFKSLDPTIQQVMLKREKDYAQGIQKYAEGAKDSAKYQEIIAPYRAMIAAKGGTVEGTLQSMLNTAYQLETLTPDKKVQLLQNLAKQYGVDLNQSNGSADDEYVDPDIQVLNTKISELQNEMMSQKVGVRNQQAQQLSVAIEAFKNDPKNEHYELVKNDMAGLFEAGVATDLEDAYDKAVRMNKDLHAKLVESQLQVREKTKKAKSDKVVAKAKKAEGVHLKSQEVVTGSQSYDSMEDELSDIYDKMS